MKNILGYLVRTTAKVAVVIGVFLFIITVFYRSIVGSPSKPPAPSIQQENKLDALLNDPENLKRPEQKIAIGTFRFISCGVAGQACTDKNKDAFNHSLFGLMANAANFAYTNPPASGVDAVYTSLASAGIVPKALAAEGIGFSKLQAFRGIWVIFRNLAFGILVIFMVAVGFMIMFRMKISAQTVISVENSLPRVVIALILITFSYAIAGFLIDIMYLLMALSIHILLQGANIADAATIAKLQNQHLVGGPSVIIDSLTPQSSAGAGGLGILGGLLSDQPWLANVANIFNLSNNLLRVMPAPIQGFVALAGYVGTYVGVGYIIALAKNSNILDILTNLQAFTFSLGNLPGSILGIVIAVATVLIIGTISVPLIMALFVFLTIVFLFFRIFFMLLSAYLRILFYVLFAPIFMLFEVLPGKNSFSYWFRNLFGELMTFPIVTAFFIFGYVMVNTFTLTDPSAPPPAVWTPPYLTDIDQNAFIYVVSMGVLFLIPDWVKMAKNALGVKEPPVSLGLGTFFAGAAIGVAGAGGLAGKGLGLVNTLQGSGASGKLLSRISGGLRSPFTSTRDSNPNRNANEQHAANPAGLNTSEGGGSFGNVVQSDFLGDLGLGGDNSSGGTGGSGGTSGGSGGRGGSGGGGGST